MYILKMLPTLELRCGVHLCCGIGAKVHLENLLGVPLAGALSTKKNGPPPLWLTKFNSRVKINNKSIIHLTRGGGVFSYVVTNFFYLPMRARKILILWHITIFAVHAFCGDIIFLCSYHTVGHANFVFFTFMQ